MSRVNFSQIIFRQINQFPRGNYYNARCVDLFLEDKNAGMKAAWDALGL